MLTPEDVADAARALGGRVRQTPVLTAGELARRVGARVVLKAENLQLTGSFKARGAFNALRLLPEAGRGARVVAASAGNHGQAVAFAAREAGASATVFMPAAAPVAKVAAVRQYGGEVHFVEGDRRRGGRARRTTSRRRKVTPSYMPSTTGTWLRVRGRLGWRSRPRLRTCGAWWCRSEAEG